MVAIDISWIPDFADWVTFKDQRQKNGNVEGQIAPNQSMTGPVDQTGLHGCEDTYQLEEQ